MRADNVIPFRKPAPSEGQLEIYRRMTRNWSTELKRLMFPECFKHESLKPVAE